MEQIASVLEAVAALMWPLIVLVVLWRFAPAVAAIIDSARSRKFTLKVGGQELTMDEVRVQQSNLIADLQTQVARLREAVEGGAGGAALTDDAPPPPARAERTPPRLLWVDDEPKNNSYFVEQLVRGGVEVDLALSTAEALERLENGAYRAVISDIGRREGPKFNRTAGLDLLAQLRARPSDVPFALFTSAAGLKQHEGAARQVGADLITASGTELTRFLTHQLPEWRPATA